MSEMKEIKDRMEILEKNQVHYSKDLEGLHSRLDQIKAELHKGKEEKPDTIKKEVNEDVSWEMEGVRREITLGFETELSKIVRFLDEKDITKSGNVSGKEKPSLSSTNTKHHETILPKGKILQEETDHDHSPNIEQPFSP